MISAVQKCEDMVRKTLLQETKRYNVLLLRLKESEINEKNIKIKSERLKEENQILVDSSHNLHLVKEELKRSQNLIEQEKDRIEIRAELEARISDTITRTISSYPDNCNNDALTEKIDEEEQNVMNILINEDDEEHLNIKEREMLDEGQNVLLDESIHIISE